MFPNASPLIVFLKSEGHVKTVSNRLKGVSKTKEHIIRLKESQNNKETVIKRKNSLRKYWDELDPNIREEKRQKNIEAQNREEVKKKISENNASKRPEVKEKQRQSALKRKKIECPHCNQFHDPGNSKKYHFENLYYQVVHFNDIKIKKLDFENLLAYLRIKLITP